MWFSWGTGWGGGVGGWGGKGYAVTWCNMPDALDATLQHVSCHLPDALDATLQHVSCHLPDALDVTLQHVSFHLPDALDATLQHVEGVCYVLFGTYSAILHATDSTLSHVLCIYDQVSKVKPVMLTFESSDFFTNWFALHRIHDTFVSLTTWAPKGRGCSHVIHDSSHCFWQMIV